MVAVKNHEADRFLESPPRHVFAYLFHGQDPGLIHERAIGLFHRSGSTDDDAFSKVRLSGDDLASDPARLADEVYSVGLFGGKRTVFVASGSKNFSGSVEAILRDPPKDCILIIEAGALRKDAPLRVAFERAREAAAIESYPDGPAELQRIVKMEASRAGLRIADEVAAEMVAHLGADRASTRSEIEKLILYAAGTQEIVSRDVEAAVADASALAIEAAITSAFQGSRGTVTETAAKAFESDNDPGVLLGSALRHCSALHRGKCSIDKGGTFEGAVASILRGNRSPVARQAVQDQLTLWSSARLLKAAILIGQAIGKCRRDTRLDQLIAIRTMWSVAQAAKSRD